MFPNYFESQKIKVSESTDNIKQGKKLFLDPKKAPQPDDELFDEDKDCKEEANDTSDIKHHLGKAQLQLKNEQQYPKMSLYLENDFNLLIHGVGSKRRFLLNFC